MSNKTVEQMTRKEFEELPFRESWGSDVEMCSLVILPLRRLHDSGFRAMDFVAVGEHMKPICRLSGCSDVIHIDGIGGYGKNWLKNYGTVPQLIPTSGWSMDCLKVSGLLRIWPSSQKMSVGPALSSFEIYAAEKELVNA